MVQTKPLPIAICQPGTREIPFTKMHGIGNDFVFIDGVAVSLSDEELPELARKMCDRRFGIGSDGLIFIEPVEGLLFRMRMLNPDGSDGGMCGNGVRCMARLLLDLGYVPGPDLEIAVGDRLLHLKVLEDGRVRVDMGVAALTRGEIGIVGDPASDFVDQPVGEFTATGVSMGNPHIVIFVEDVDAVDLDRIGPLLETDTMFPNRTNVHVAQVVPGGLKMRTWERGAGITLACGSGACSVGVAGFLTGRSGRHSTIQLRGGNLDIEYREDGHVFMTGPAETSFSGTWFAG